VALYKSVPLVSVVFAGAAAFIVLIYGTSTLLSVLQLTYSRTPERRAGGETALRLLLGSLGHEEAIERARADALVAAIRNSPPGKDLTIQVPPGGRGLEGVMVTQASAPRAEPRLIPVAERGKQKAEWD
jgi:hypothetical protein